MKFYELIDLAKKANIKYTCNFSDNKKLENTEIENFCIDSRQVGKNSLFVCIKGEKSNGHDYIDSCAEHGATALLAQEEYNGKYSNDLAILYVENTVEALQKLAHARREEFKGKVIAITGTSGKTSVKEMLFQVLSQKGKTAKNHLNFNTQIGVSLSILNTDNDEDFWVLEAGISHEHDMEEIAKILTPDVALVLNVGLAHAEGLPMGAAYYKTQLFSYLKKNEEGDFSQAFASMDYPELQKEALKKFPHTTFYSIVDEKCDYFARYTGLDAHEKGIFKVRLNNETFEIKAPLRSDYGAENCLAICCIASLFMTKEEIIQAFSTTTSPKQRFEISHFNSITLIDDCYNANPLSFKRMIKAAKEYCRTEKGKEKSFICLVGAMYELGEIAEKEHEILAQELALAKVEKIYYTGAYASAFEKGLENSSFYSQGNGTFNFLTNADDFEKEIKDLQLTDCLFLVKGSRSNHLEHYSQKIREIYG